jgi:hypothetical protein
MYSSKIGWVNPRTSNYVHLQSTLIPEALIGCDSPAAGFSLVVWHFMASVALGSLASSTS